MEASALPVPAARGRILISAKLLRLRSDEQLVGLFREGSEEAFRAIHDRYRQRLFAYVRQMLAGSRPDAEDALQDVFVRAHTALRADRRPVSLKAWLYRIAHNRCIDELRRPAAIPTEMIELNFASLHDPVFAAEQRAELRRLVGDVQDLPDHQRSALLMRELQGMSYAELADALEVSIPAVKSLLLRARTGLIEAAIARDTPCETIQADLVHAHDSGTRASARARRHVRECEHCAEYRTRLRSLERSFAALSPAAPLGLGILAKLFGGSGAAAGGAGATGSFAGGGAALGGAATMSAGKVAALVCCAALVTAGVTQPAALRVTAPAVHHAHRLARPGAAGAAAVRVPDYAEASPPALQARTGGAVYRDPPTRHSGAYYRLRARRRASDQYLTGQDSPYPAVVAPTNTGAAGGTAGAPATSATPSGGQGAGSSLLNLLGPKRGSGQQSPSSSTSSSSGSSGSGSATTTQSGSSSGSTSGGSQTPTTTTSSP